MEKNKKVINDWKDIYKLPLHRAKYGSWVYDTESNFVFEFEEFKSDTDRNIVIDILNGTEITKPKHTYFYNQEDQYIYQKETMKPVILIRGWGNLTGTGAHNLDADIAAKIQDTFAEWIVSNLTVTESQSPIKEK